jgi:hypothetical protein
MIGNKSQNLKKAIKKFFNLLRDGKIFVEMAENQCPESAKLGTGNDDRQIGKQNLEQLVKTKIMKAGKSNSLDPC